LMFHAYAAFKPTLYNVRTMNIGSYYLLTTI
jgi:hypothetical protein